MVDADADVEETTLLFPGNCVVTVEGIDVEVSLLFIFLSLSISS